MEIHVKISFQHNSLVSSQSWH